MTNAMLNDAPNFVPAVPLPPVEESPTEMDVIERVEAVFAEVDSLCEMLDLPEKTADEQNREVVFAEADSLWDLLEVPARPSSQQSLPADLIVSVVIPVYNEKKTVLDVIAGVRALPFETEIIVVDDCSTDGTRGWLETIRGAPGLELILKNENEGKGAALRDGFAAATGNIVVVQDADLEYDPADIEKVIRPIVAGNADVAYGSRYLIRRDSDPSFLHRAFNRGITAISNWCTGLKLTDMETCHKAFRRNIIRELPLRQNRFGFEPEVTAKIARRKYRIAETPVSYSPRRYAEGKKIGVWDAFNAMYCIARYGLAD